MRAIYIDILRILLCLAVIEFHYFKLINAGPLAVVGFFVMSGYFLEREFEGRETLDFRAFYRKKALHLLPEYLVSSIPAAIITIWFPFIYTVDFSWVDASPFTLISLLEAANNPSWFLTCLFFFIAIAPILFCLHCRRRGIELAFILCFVYGLAVLAYGSREHWHHTPIQVAMAYFLGGMVSRRLFREVPLRPTLRLLMAGAGLGGLVGILLLGHAGRGIPFSQHVEALLFMLLLPALYVHLPCERGWQRAVASFSALTYAMYLFHSPIRRTGTWLLCTLRGVSEEELLTAPLLGLFLLLTIGAAALFRRAKRHFLPSS